MGDLESWVGPPPGANVAELAGAPSASVEGGVDGVALGVTTVPAPSFFRSSKLHEGGGNTTGGFCCRFKLRFLLSVPVKLATAVASAKKRVGLGGRFTAASGVLSSVAGMSVVLDAFLSSE